MISVKQLTWGPRCHWFGYYDKQEVDPTGRLVLGMSVDFEHRSPTGDDVIKLGMIDLESSGEWVPLGESCAWGWQQGCMLQWLPEHGRTVFWNDRIDDQFVCRIMDVDSGTQRVLPSPVYAVSPDGRWGITPDFRRINDTRPGYGYAGLPDPDADDPAPAASGIWRVDLESGESELVLSLAAAAAMPSEHYQPGETKHWFNHLLFNTDGTRFLCLQRWAVERSFQTRMLTARLDGSDIHVIDDYGGMSHFVWRDPRTIFAWSWQPSHESAFYLYDDLTGEVEVIGKGVMKHNGHCTYLPGDQWILNDTYPQGDRREQELYLYEVATGRRVDLGRFHSPAEYRGEWRCDLHPRADRTGKRVFIDSVHGGDGRQIYMLDIERVTAG